MDYFLIFSIGLFLGLFLGISCSYHRIVKDKKFSWKGKFYTIKQLRE